MQKTCYLRIRIRQLKKALTMLIEERYKDGDTGSDGINSLPKLELKTYEIQMAIDDAYEKRVNQRIVFHEQLPKWNYLIKPA